MTAWPPPLPPNTRLDLDPQASDHPDDHNTITEALTEVVGVMATRFQVNRSGLGTYSLANDTETSIMPGNTMFLSPEFTISGTQMIYGGSRPVTLLVTASVRYGIASAGFRKLAILYNGNEQTASHSAANDSGYTALSVSCLREVQPGDYLQYSLWQNRGSALDVSGYSGTSFAACGLAGA